MNRIDEETARHINDEVRKYFYLHRISHREAAALLGYSSPNVVYNQLSRHHFAKHTASRWAKAFGFNESFLLTGKGRLTVRQSGYQRLIRENEALRNIISVQRLTIERLKAGKI